MSNKPSEKDLKALKAGGIIKMKEPDVFSVRLGIVGGHVTASELAVLSNLADKYGRGQVHLTTRQGVEIPFVHFNDLDALRQELTNAGISVAGCGPRVRTLVACPGTSCNHGLIDSQGLARQMAEVIKDQALLPHKFKPAIAGCPNNCPKAMENDFGVQGVCRREFHVDKCVSCKLCVDACPIAGTLEMDGKKLVYHPETCIACGKCSKACPTDAWETVQNGYSIYLGGKMGRQPRIATRLPFVLTTAEDVLELLVNVLQWYRDNGQGRERFGSTIDRVGWEKLVADLNPKAAWVAWDKWCA